MSIAETDLRNSLDPPSCSSETSRRLHQAFGVQFAVFDGESGESMNVPEDQPWLRSENWTLLVRAAARAGVTDVIADEDSLVLLAIPIVGEWNRSVVAVATFATQPLQDVGSLEEVAQRWGCSDAELTAWIRRQAVWPVEPLIRVAESTRELLESSSMVPRLEREADELSRSLSRSFEEVTLLYGITRNLRLSRSVEDLAQMSMQWLAECIPANAFAAVLVNPAPSETEDAGASSPRILKHGEMPLSDDRLWRLVQQLQPDPDETALVANTNVTSQESWLEPAVEQLIIATLTEGKHVFGYLIAINHRDEDEFGSIEGSLLGSVASLLGIQAGNRQLYLQQARLLKNVVRALTSAIDAKDPYTCGHSERVARISSLLAEKLGWNEEQVAAIYMAGVLHDVGKIGINDAVLRKPSKLTAEEFSHIKEHPEKGFRILAGIPELDHILPAVLYHHEQWNGSGYPCGLAGEKIPQIARIVAVADAFDAMTSDRPYRSGMHIEKVDAIFAEGAGEQWDAQVVEAYFSIREELTKIISRLPPEQMDPAGAAATSA